ncbi:unnamed protein product [Cuscuta europaea]|uniref:Uncharacterized protein n=1 Tax=Cuscuta europaea TaxID=41803 RepID=A0A9P0YGM2_CUSEU|nr:unnamed protein product [Cuscuta europaea]
MTNIGSPMLSGPKNLPFPMVLMITCLFWNVCGIGNTQSSDHLNLLCKNNNVNFLALIEPKINASKLNNKMMSFGFTNAISHSFNKIWIMWNNSLIVTVISDLSQCVNLSVMTLLVMGMACGNSLISLSI